MLIIRLSEDRDTPALLELDLTVWNLDNSPADLSQTTLEEYARSYPAGSQLVAELDGRVCGYVNMKPPTPLATNSHVAELAIAVSADCRGTGVGRALLEAAGERALAQGKRKLYLRVLSTNAGAISFYKKCGFIEQGRLVEEFFINGRYVDDLLMYKPLMS